MSTHRVVDRVMYWMPRVVGVLFAGFISLFALDVFGEGYGFWHTALALMVHLVPTFVVVGALVIAWRYEVLGGVLLLVLAGWYVMETWGRFSRGAEWVIAGPLVGAGLLFWCDWVYRAKWVGGREGV